jgi:hypothetical protein
MPSKGAGSDRSIPGQQSGTKCQELPVHRLSKSTLGLEGTRGTFRVLLSRAEI